MKYILAIDQGTTNSRVIVYDHMGRSVASASAEFMQYFPRPGWVEHDPEGIWNSVVGCLRKVIRSVGPGTIAAVGIANQRESVFVWDRQTGRPLYRAIVWQCRRSASRCAALAADKDFSSYVRRATGLPVDAYFSASKLEWILRNVPGAARRASSGELLFGTADSWLLWKLTGGRVHATDYTNASRTMLFDIVRLRWDPKLLKKFGVPGCVMPEVKPSSGFFGTTSGVGGLTAGTPICGMAGDQQASLFGQCCFEPGSIKNTYGTGCFLLQNTGREPVRSSAGLITTLACGPDGGPAYALEGSVFMAGAALQWLRDGLGIIKSSAQTAQLVRSLKGNEGVYMVPAFVGLGAPYWDSGVRGAVFGLTRGTGRSHFVRAALEAMCYQTRDVMEAMRCDSGLRIKSLKVDGGAAANDFVCSFQSGITGVEVVRPRVIETTSLGAAYLAGLACGYWKGASGIKACWAVDRKFSPMFARAEAEILYGGWRKAVGCLLGHSGARARDKTSS